MISLVVGVSGAERGVLILAGTRAMLIVGATDISANSNWLKTSNISSSV